MAARERRVRRRGKPAPGPAKLEAGVCWINNYNVTPVEAPFGGNKRSGNGREWGELGFEEFLEVKAVLGY